MSVDYYDRQGQPMTQADWIPRLNDKSYQVIAYDRFDVSGQSIGVSTVWLGMNHNWGSGPPLIFETLVFDGPLDGQMDRYATEAEAIAGHAAMCDLVRES